MNSLVVEFDFIADCAVTFRQILRKETGDFAVLSIEFYETS